MYFLGIWGGSFFVPFQSFRERNRDCFGRREREVSSRSIEKRERALDMEEASLLLSWKKKEKEKKGERER